MVGYNKHDTNTQNEKLVAGVVSGITTRFLTQPMDLIKIRSQLVKKPKTHSVVYRIARRVYWEEGITAFWQGHCLGQIHSIIAVSSQFYIYEITTKFAAGFSIPKHYKPITSFICGSLSGCVCTCLVIPLEVIRVRQMLVKSQYKGFVKGAKAVYRYGGPFAFYEGLSASLLQMGPQVGISFTVFSTMQPLILKQFTACAPGECSRGNKSGSGNMYKPEYLMIASSIAGFTAGFISKTLTYPFDLAKRRLQIASHKSSPKYNTPSQAKSLAKCKKLTTCLKLAYEKEGLKGLYRGWTVTVYKAQLTSVIGFTTYELVCYATREYDSHKSSPKYNTPSQAKSLAKCKKLTTCLKLAYEKEGLKGLFRGWTVTVYKAQLTSVITFTTYELVCYATREYDAR